ncbi:hypothetical protein ACFFSW_29575 [Saccharothrix longispora]|uniref:Uncharacterized protein n=1 Tax=Saccharothrix longispora TaxID=33920 RepID=A0ABU1PX44_9PSEU|nr:hypothetical protein [Saccharothrix longispora]MDR6595011.1 hypothetical protein [Saccharothrix longispora]
MPPVAPARGAVVEHDPARLLEPLPTFNRTRPGDDDLDPEVAEIGPIADRAARAPRGGPGRGVD